MVDQNIKSKKPLIMVILIICIILMVIGYLMLSSDGGMTAKEAVVFADSAAFNWSNNATLMYAIDLDGWTFEYWDGTDSIECITIIIVDRVGSISFDNTKMFFTQGPIKNWTVDSDDALEIARSHEFYSEYRKTNSDSDYIMDLKMDDAISYNAFWEIKWRGDTSNLNIFVDGSTGEILE